MSRLSHNPGRVIATGLLIVGFGAILIASPLVLGHGDPVKYIVTFGIAGACLGLSILLHGLWDLMIRKP